MQPPSDLNALTQLIAAAGAKQGGMPPVDQWNPPFCGDIDMEIRTDGLWYYLGTPIGRPALVKLFASVLRKDDDGKTYLVTPVEKVGIGVLDAPFLGVEMAVEGDDADKTLVLRTNVDDVIRVGADNPLRFEIEPETMGLKPYVHVRGRLDALMTRALMYDLVAMGEIERLDGVDMFVVVSGGVTFPIMEAATLEALSL